MYNPYINSYNPQVSVDRINSQIAELEKLKQQIPTVQQPTNLTQNFQIAPNNDVGIKYANDIGEVEKSFVLNDTPFFSKDMSIVWIKNIKNEIKIYTLAEVIQKDEKDLLIESLQMQINELKEGMKNVQPNDEYVYEPIKDEKSTDGKSNTRNDKKQR